MRDRPSVVPFVALVVAFAFLTLFGCGPKTKPTLVKIDTAVYDSVKALHDTAIVLGQSGILTPAQELAIQKALLPVAQLGEQATRVIAAWKSGPTPPELQQLVKALGDLTAEIVTLIPQESGAKATLLAKIAAVQQAVLTVLVVVGGLT